MMALRALARSPSAPPKLCLVAPSGLHLIRIYGTRRAPNEVDDLPKVRRLNASSWSAPALWSFGGSFAFHLAPHPRPIPKAPEGWSTPRTGARSTTLFIERVQPDARR